MQKVPQICAWDLETTFSNKKNKKSISRIFSKEFFLGPKSALKMNGNPSTRWFFLERRTKQKKAEKRQVPQSLKNSSVPQDQNTTKRSPSRFGNRISFTENLKNLNITKNCFRIFWNSFSKQLSQLDKSHSAEKTKSCQLRLQNDVVSAEKRRKELMFAKKWKKSHRPAKLLKCVPLVFPYFYNMKVLLVDTYPLF